MVVVYLITLARNFYSKKLLASVIKYTITICTEEDSSGQPRANQGVSQAEPRDGHVVGTLQVHPPTSPCPTLSAEAEPISKGHGYPEAELAIYRRLLPGKC